jgi:signal transduction histidine kinase
LPRGWSTRPPPPGCANWFAPRPGERRAEQGRLNLADGRNFAFAAVPLPDGNALFTMIDVTDSSRIEAALRERAEALEQADQVRTDFVANMSYELRTPLTSIGGFAEMLREGYAGALSGPAKDYVAAILESVARLSRLIDDVLDLTQGAKGEVALERERVDLAGLIRTVTVQMEAAAKAKKLRFKVVIGEGTGASPAITGACAKALNMSFATQLPTPTRVRSG